MTKISNGYDKKYMKIKFNSNDELPLNKMIEITSIIIVVRAAFHENNKYYPQVFLDECLYKLYKLKVKKNLRNDIKNRACYDITKDFDTKFDILLDKKLYKNIAVHTNFNESKTIVY